MRCRRPRSRRRSARCKRAGALGARIMGGGFGGHVLALMPPGLAARGRGRGSARGRGAGDGLMTGFGVAGRRRLASATSLRSRATTRSVELSAEARAAMERSAAVVVARAASDEPAYGITTGFGSLALVRIPAEARVALQQALVRSHAAGMGPPVEREVVRAMMLLRARTLAMGCSGARPVVAERFLALLRCRIDPGRPRVRLAGGERRPRAARALRAGADRGGAGGRWPRWVRQPAADALAAAGIEPIELTAKEGLALINGTDGMLGMLVLAWPIFEGLLRVGGRGRGDVGRGAARDRPGVRRGPDRACGRSPGRWRARPICGRCWPGSEIVASHRVRRPAGPGRVLAAVRAPGCGAARDALVFASGVASVELRSAIDNPMVLPDGRVESCGNFHGAPVGMACDFSRSRRRRSARSPSGGPTGCSMLRGRTACRRSWLRVRGSTRG